MDKRIRRIVTLVCILAVAIGLWNIASIQLEYFRSKKAYEQVVAAATEESKVSEATVPETTVPETTVPETTEPNPYADVEFPEVDFDNLKEINEEIVAWFVNEGTTINYPVAHTDNNDFYLEHMYDKKGNGSGCIFLDCDDEPDFSTRNNILYGHNMKNGTMFNSLMGYKSQEYYQEHPTMLLMTPKQNYVVEIFSAYVTDVEGNGWMTEFDSDEDFHDWEHSCLDRSEIETDVKLSDEDIVLTLSTCTYEFYDARFLVQGVLRKAG